MVKGIKALEKQAERIKDKKIRKLVIDFIRNPEPSHAEFKQALTLEETPAAPGARQARPFGMIEHTLSTADLAEAFARHFNKHYKLDINVDYVIAGAILHDIMKSVEFGQEGNSYGFAEVALNHLDLMTAEMYQRGFPKILIHLVASHFGETSPTPPMTYESLCLHYADTMDTAFATSAESERAQNEIRKLMLKASKKK